MNGKNSRRRIAAIGRWGKETTGVSSFGRGRFIGHNTRHPGVLTAELEGKIDGKNYVVR